MTSDIKNIVRDARKMMAEKPTEKSFIVGDVVNGHDKEEQTEAVEELPTEKEPEIT